MTNTQKNANETLKTPGQVKPTHAPQQDQSGGESGAAKPEQPQQK